MRVIRGKRRLSRIVWNHPGLRGRCTVFEDRTVEVRALGKPLKLYFFLLRKKQNPFLISVLTRLPQGPWTPPSESFSPVPAYKAADNGPFLMQPGTWIGNRKVAKEAAQNVGLPSTVIDNICQSHGARHLGKVRKKYPAWPVVGTIPVHVALQESRRWGRGVVLLCGTKRKPIIVAAAGKPTDPDAYSPAPPALVWQASSGGLLTILDFDLGPLGLPRNHEEAKEFFDQLELNIELLNEILP
jgi:hypothetical protein